MPLDTKDPTKLLRLKGKLEIEAPNKNLHSFNGQLILGKDDRITLSEKQLLLKGANLKNTDWIVGLCVFSGDQTKIMLNSQKGRQKMSHLEMGINRLVINIIIVQCIVSSLLAIGSQLWLTRTFTDWWNDIFTIDSEAMTPTDE